MNNMKIEKFENKLSSKISTLYKQLDSAKKDYESHLQNFGFSDTITRDIAKIQIIEAKIQSYEDILDDFGYIFERGQE